MKSELIRCISALTALLALTACGASIPRSPVPNNYLIQASCPPRVPATDDSLAGWERKAYELAEQYDKCRASALN